MPVTVPRPSIEKHQFSYVVGIYKKSEFGFLAAPGRSRVFARNEGGAGSSASPIQKNNFIIRRHINNCPFECGQPQPLCQLSAHKIGCEIMRTTAIAEGLQVAVTGISI